MKSYTLRAGKAAEILKVTTQAVRDMAKAGKLTYELRERGSRQQFWFNREEVEALAQVRDETA